MKPMTRSTRTNLERLATWLEQEEERIEKNFSTFWNGFGVCVATSLFAAIIVFMIHFYTEDVQGREALLGTPPALEEQESDTVDGLLTNRG